MTAAEKRNDVVATQDRQPAERPPQQEAGALMTIIDRISSLPDLTSDKLDQVERLFAMHQQMLDRQAEQLFNEDMARTQSEIQPVVANKENKHTKSLYSDIDAIHAEAKPIWTRNGFSVVTRTAPSTIQNHIKVICEVRHSAGHKEVHEDDWPLDTVGAQGNANKTAIQGKGSTSTYARRYTELGIFDIAIKRLDKDGNAAPQLSQRAGDWIAAINESADMDSLKKTYKEAFAELKKSGDSYGLNQINKAKDNMKRSFANG